LSNKKEKRSVGERVALVGVFTALAMIFSYVEVLIPFNFGIPGVKLGIANLVIVAGLYFLRLPEVWFISMLRILLTGILFGNGMSLLYSFSGGILSLLLMMLFQRINCCSIVGVSMIGAVCHNIGQVSVAVCVTKTASIFYYLPILMITGVVTGTILGIVAGKVLSVIETVYQRAAIHPRRTLR
jgi:heptaprenyl diphosphate synthase